MKKPKKSMMKPAAKKAPMKVAAKEPAHDVSPPDQAYERNFTKKGTPKLSASSGEGAMGQRR